MENIENDLNVVNQNAQSSTPVLRVKEPAVKQVLGTITIIRTGGALGAVLNVTNKITAFGSSTECDVCIHSEDLAPQHVLIDASSNGVLTLVRASEEGTVLVNNKPMKQPIILGKADLVTIGDRSFLISSYWEPTTEMAPSYGFRKKTMESATTTMSDRRRRTSIHKQMSIQMPTDSSSNKKEPSSARRVSEVSFLQLPKAAEKAVNDRQEALQRDLQCAATPTKSALRKRRTSNERLRPLEERRRKSVVFDLPTEEIGPAEEVEDDFGALSAVADELLAPQPKTAEDDNNVVMDNVSDDSSSPSSPESSQPAVAELIESSHEEPTQRVPKRKADARRISLPAATIAPELIVAVQEPSSASRVLRVVQKRNTEAIAEAQRQFEQELNIRRAEPVSQLVAEPAQEITESITTEEPETIEPASVLPKKEDTTEAPRKAKRRAASVLPAPTQAPVVPPRREPGSAVKRKREAIEKAPSARRSLMGSASATKTTTTTTTTKSAVRRSMTSSVTPKTAAAAPRSVSRISSVAAAKIKADAAAAVKTPAKPQPLSARPTSVKATTPAASRIKTPSAASVTPASAKVSTRRTSVATKPLPTPKATPKATPARSIAPTPASTNRTATTSKTPSSRRASSVQQTPFVAAAAPVNPRAKLFTPLRKEIETTGKARKVATRSKPVPLPPQLQEKLKEEDVVTASVETVTVEEFEGYADPVSIIEYDEEHESDDEQNEDESEEEVEHTQAFKFMPIAQDEDDEDEAEDFEEAEHTTLVPFPISRPAPADEEDQAEPQAEDMEMSMVMEGDGEEDESEEDEDEDELEDEPEPTLIIPAYSEIPQLEEPAPTPVASAPGSGIRTAKRRRMDTMTRGEIESRANAIISGLKQRLQAQTPAPQLEEQTETEEQEEGESEEPAVASTEEAEEPESESENEDEGEQEENDEPTIIIPVSAAIPPEIDQAASTPSSGRRMAKRRRMDTLTRGEIESRANEISDRLEKQRQVSAEEKKDNNEDIAVPRSQPATPRRALRRKSLAPSVAAAIEAAEIEFTPAPQSSSMPSSPRMAKRRRMDTMTRNQIEAQAKKISDQLEQRRVDAEQTTTSRRALRHKSVATAAPVEPEVEYEPEPEALPAENDAPEQVAEDAEDDDSMGEQEIDSEAESEGEAEAEKPVDEPEVEAVPTVSQPGTPRRALRRKSLVATSTPIPDPAEEAEVTEPVEEIEVEPVIQPISVPNSPRIAKRRRMDTMTRNQIEAQAKKISDQLEQKRATAVEESEVAQAELDVEPADAPVAVNSQPGTPRRALRRKSLAVAQSEHVLDEVPQPERDLELETAPVSQPGTPRRALRRKSLAVADIPEQPEDAGSEELVTEKTPQSVPRRAQRSMRASAKIDEEESLTVEVQRETEKVEEEEQGKMEEPEEETIAPAKVATPVRRTVKRKRVQKVSVPEPEPESQTVAQPEQEPEEDVVEIPVEKEKTPSPVQPKRRAARRRGKAPKQEKPVEEPESHTENNTPAEQEDNESPQTKKAKIEKAEEEVVTEVHEVAVEEQDSTAVVVDANTVVDGKRIGAMLVADLKKALKKRDCSIAGLKAALVQRLIEAVQAELSPKKDEDATPEEEEETTTEKELEQVETPAAESESEEEVVVQPKAKRTAVRRRGAASKRKAADIEDEPKKAVEEDEEEAPTPEPEVKKARTTRAVPKRTGRRQAKKQEESDEEVEKVEEVMEEKPKPVAKRTAKRRGAPAKPVEEVVEDKEESDHQEEKPKPVKRVARRRAGTRR